mmetsp:Transcript_29454/g.85869  ORF Transcript_29454/g.85869 Transcript_29454/m.85869 type:complete len:201 (-) Transcript_29454:1358-1960(-)
MRISSSWHPCSATWPPRYAHQLFVAPLLRDLAAPQEDDFVSTTDSAQTVGDDKGSAPLPLSQEPVQRRLHNSLALVVQCAGGFVKDEYLRLADESSRDGHSLLLPPTELAPAVAHRCGIALREGHDEVVGIGEPSSFLHLLLGSDVALRCTKGDVLRDGPAEELGLLPHHGDVTAEPAKIQVRQAVPIHSDGPTCRVVEA